MQEAGVVLDLKGEAIYYHTPTNRGMAHLGDSSDLWQFLWTNRKQISGFGHSHPGYGPIGPSWTDITTFCAIEQGLGFRLDWWITSGDQLYLVKFEGPEKHNYLSVRVNATPNWVHHLRDISGYYQDYQVKHENMV